MSCLKQPEEMNEQINNSMGQTKMGIWIKENQHGDDALANRIFELAYLQKVLNLCNLTSMRGCITYRISISLTWKYWEK